MKIKIDMRKRVSYNLQQLEKDNCLNTKNESEITFSIVFFFNTYKMDLEPKA
jgi:hypothetical protein